MTVKEMWGAVNSGKNADVLFNLYERWLDERGYEDIQDYLVVVKRFIPGAYKMTGRPFGFKAMCDDGELIVSLKRDGSYVKIYGQMRRAAGSAA